MRRPNASLLALPFLFGTALAACGGDGGGGVSQAYCDAAEELQEVDEDENASVDENIEAFEDLADEAPGDLEEQFDLVSEAVEAVVDLDAEAVEDIDQDDLDDAADAINDLTQEECDVDLDIDLDLPDPDELVEESEGDTGADGAGTTDDTTGGGGGSGEFDELIDDCGAGDMAACDELFQVTPVGSPEEEFGATCGGLVPVDEAVPGQCEAQFG